MSDEPASATLTEIVSLFTRLEAGVGNLPVLLWDDKRVCKFNNINNIVFHDVKGRRVFLGGFLCNADEFYQMVEK